jgi:hypothetical protein
LAERLAPLRPAGQPPASETEYRATEKPADRVLTMTRCRDEKQSQQQRHERAIGGADQHPGEDIDPARRGGLRDGERFGHAGYVAFAFENGNCP